MRVFIFYSNTIRTDGNFKDLYHSGRVDILVNSLIHAFFLSHGLRKHIIFDGILNGPPVPPRRIRIESNINTPWSKKDVTTLLSSALKKFNKRREPLYAFPGVFVERKGFREVIEEYIQQGKNIYVLDKGGVFIEEIPIENPVFVVGDFIGIPKKEIKWLKDKAEFISLGNLPYFSSQVIMVLNWYLDKINYYKDYWDTEDRAKDLFKKLKR